MEGARKCLHLAVCFKDLPACGPLCPTAAVFMGSFLGDKCVGGQGGPTHQGQKVSGTNTHKYPTVQGLPQSHGSDNYLSKRPVTHITLGTSAQVFPADLSSVYVWTRVL